MCIVLGDDRKCFKADCFVLLCSSSSACSIESGRIVRKGQRAAELGLLLSVGIKNGKQQAGRQGKGKQKSKQATE